MKKELLYINSELFKDYREQQEITISKHFEKLKSISGSSNNFDFYFSASAVYSSMIEGNIIDLDSFMKYKHSGMNTKGKSYKEIQDLQTAYFFAKSNGLTKANFLKAHALLSKTLIEENKYRGKLRDKHVFIYGNGKKIYEGASTDVLKKDFYLLFADIDTLIKSDLNYNEIFYYASLIHLYVALIHPFADGNGRSARLIEKWFIANKLGNKAWFIQSEKLYQKRIVSYYKNINMGSNYNNLNMNHAVRFALMLPMALRIKP